MNWLFDGRWSLVLPCWAVLVVGCSDDGVPQDDASAGSVSGATSSDSQGSATNGMTNGTSGTSGTSADATGPADGSSGGMTTGLSTGGSDETGTGTGGPPSMGCESDADCVVVDDCCTCGAKHVDDREPVCEMRECDQSTCSSYGVSEPKAVCRFGTCELEPVPCNEAEVVCDGPVPVCPDGLVPSVDPETSCWTQDCVPPELCDVVPDCSHCADHEACVEIQAMIGTFYACEPIDPSCGGEASCDCMEGACPPPTDTCADGPNGLQCSCPAC